MSHAAAPICFHCGLPAPSPDATEGPKLNRMQDGETCPTCADRLLDLLPPALPRVGARAEESA